MERAMMWLALRLTPFVMAWMVYDAIDRALSPYEPAFYEWGGLAALAFICCFWGRGLDDRLHRMETQGEGPAPRG